VIVGRAEGGSYALIAGERRWRAARMAGLRTVPALVKDASPREALELALVENLQRADLTPLEEAGAYRQLVDEYHLTQDQLATRLGRSRTAVTNRLRLLSLPAGALTLLAEGAISEGHARALLGSSDPSMVEVLAQHVAERGLSVRETEELVRRSAADGNSAGRTMRAAQRDSALSDIEEQLQRALGTRVQVLRSRHGGRVVVHFYDDAQLEGLMETLLGGSIE
jgi:ParB family chromosome partitioning protein